MSHPSVIGVYGIKPPFEFLHLTGAKVALKHASEKLISVSQINNQKYVRTSSPVYSIQHSYTSSDGFKGKDYSKDSVKTAINKDYATHAKVDALHSTYNVQLKRSASPTQRYIHSSQGLDQRFTLNNKDTKSKNNLKDSRENSAKLQNAEVKRSPSVRELVANILQSVMNKNTNTKGSDSVENEISANDVNNNISPTFTGNEPTNNPEASSTAKITEWENADFYSQYTRSQPEPKINSSKKKGRTKSKKLNISSTPIVAHIKPSKTDNSDSSIVISKANPVVCNLQKRIEMRRSQSLSQSNTTTSPLDSLKRSVHSPILRRNSLDLDTTNPGKQSLSNTRRPLQETKRTTEAMPLKILKVYQSEKQTGTVKDMGECMVGAPPATPMPEVLHKVKYVPCMADIRAQRAVKAELEMLQRKEQKKQEKELEEKRQQEKVQRKDAERKLKTRQRQEIYALNKIMTELEYNNFKKFCRAHGIPS